MIYVVTYGRHCKRKLVAAEKEAKGINKRFNHIIRTEGYFIAIAFHKILTKPLLLASNNRKKAAMTLEQKKKNFFLKGIISVL